MDTGKLWIDKLGGRKFLLATMTVIGAMVMLWFGKMTASTFEWTLATSLSMMGAGNISEHISRAWGRAKAPAALEGASAAPVMPTPAPSMVPVRNPRIAPPTSYTEG